MGGLGLVIALVLTPHLAAQALSSDHRLEPHTVVEVNAWRALLAFASALILAAGLVWTRCRNSAWVRRIEADYARWQSPVLEPLASDRSWLRKANLLLALAPALALVTIWLSFDNYGAGWFALLAFESGLLETAQAVCLLWAGIVLTRMAWSDTRRRTDRFSWVGLAFGLLLIFGAGEEVSWGQHWLGFESPEALRAVNVQDEFNLHNIGSYWVNHLQALLFLVYLGLWPALGYLYPQLHYLLDRLSMPIAPLAVLPVVLLGSSMDEHDTLARLWNRPPWRLSEGRELLFAATVLMTTLLMTRYRKRSANEPGQVKVSG